MESNDEGPRNLPQPPAVFSQTSESSLRQRIKKPPSYYADEIERGGRIALIPCERCDDLGLVCYVGKSGHKCAGCTRASKTVAQCGVDVDSYRRAPTMLQIGDEATQSRSSAGFEPDLDIATPTTPPNDIPNLLAVDKKVDMLAQNTREAFDRVTTQMDEFDATTFEHTSVIKNLQARVDQLEEMVSTLVRNFPGKSAQR